MACLPSDHEAAVREVAQVYELIKNHPLFHLQQLGQQEPLEMTKVVQSLLGEALRALNIALSVMKLHKEKGSSTTASPQQVVEAGHPLSPFRHASATAGLKEAVSTSARNRKRRRSSVMEGANTSRVTLTTIPYDDRFVWRKYGEKKINGTRFTRSYFRCTYKDDKGCLATKKIQQKDNSDPPVFQVTYNNEHTCNYRTTSLAKKNSNCNNLPAGGSSGPPTIGHHAMPIKQQDIQIPCQEPIPLAHVSAVPLDQERLCQVLVPTGDNSVTARVVSNHANIPSATGSGVGDSSCIPQMSSDDLDMGPIMTPQLMGDYSELQDIDLLMLYDSLEYN